MPELDSITGTGTLSSATKLLGYGGGDVGTGYPIADILDFGLPAITSIGTMSLTGSETLPIIKGGELYLASIDEIVAAGGGGGGGGGGVSTLDPTDTKSTLTFSNDNLTVTQNTGGSYAGVRSTIPRSSGKLYLELTVGAIGSTGALSFGVSAAGSAFMLFNNIVGYDVFSVGWTKYANQFMYNNEGYGGALLAGIATGDVIGIAVDFGNHNIWMRINGGLWDGTEGSNPATNTGGLSGGDIALQGLLGGLFKLPLFFALSLYDAGDSHTINFGASDFAFTPPSGFSAWG